MATIKTSIGEVKEVTYLGAEASAGKIVLKGTLVVTDGVVTYYKGNVYAVDSDGINIHAGEFNYSTPVEYEGKIFYAGGTGNSTIHITNADYLNIQPDAATLLLGAVKGFKVETVEAAG